MFFLNMNKSTAKTVAANILNACEHLNIALIEIQQYCDEAEFKEHREVFANIIASLQLDILDKIYLEHPDIKELDPSFCQNSGNQ